MTHDYIFVQIARYIGRIKLSLLDVILPKYSL